MSISDLEDDGTFETPIKGDGFSVSTDGRRVRFDVWDDTQHWSVPFTGWPVTDKRKQMAIEALRSRGMKEQVDRLEACL